MLASSSVNTSAPVKVSLSSSLPCKSTSERCPFPVQGPFTANVERAGLGEIVILLPNLEVQESGIGGNLCPSIKTFRVFHFYGQWI